MTQWDGKASEVMKQEKKRERQHNWQQKALHGQYLRQTEGKRTKTWMWLQRGDMKRETEATLMAAQDQAITTNAEK